MTKMSPTFINYINLQIQEMQWTPRKIKWRKITPTDKERWNHLESYQRNTLGILEKSGSDDNRGITKARRQCTNL